MDIKERLRQKGWNEADIERALEIMYYQDKAPEKVQVRATGSLLLYWSGLFVAIISNIVLSVVLIPFLISTSGPALYFMIAVLGLAFGFLITVLLRDIEHIDYKHHIIAGLFIPVLAIINVYVMVALSNRIATNISSAGALFFQHNPIIISIVYVVSFIAPFFILMISEMSQRASSETHEPQSYK